MITPDASIQVYVPNSPFGDFTEEDAELASQDLPVSVSAPPRQGRPGHGGHGGHGGMRHGFALEAILLITLSAAATPFLQGYFSEMGKDAWLATKSAVSRILSRLQTRRAPGHFNGNALTVIYISGKPVILESKVIKVHEDHLEIAEIEHRYRNSIELYLNSWNEIEQAIGRIEQPDDSVYVRITTDGMRISTCRSVEVLPEGAEITRAAPDEQHPGPFE
ncbi:hypothetical protein [Streptomyces sp. NPDC059371]|uniref:hypothetical protein n=1 Tax=Streptomyces sp. NPDC059371 TaxID=3346812 RepID=UPI00368B8015